MSKITNTLKETSGFAIFSFLLVIFSWFLSYLFSSSGKRIFYCSYVPAIFSGIAVTMGIAALTYIHIIKVVKGNNLKGKWLSILGIILGIVGFFALMPLCGA